MYFQALLSTNKNLEQSFNQQASGFPVASFLHNKVLTESSNVLANLFLSLGIIRAKHFDLPNA